MTIDFEARKRRVKEWEEGLAIRYKKAFNEDKVNWLMVKFDPITPIYKEQKKEQKYLAEYGFNLEQEWRPRTHLLTNDNSEPERQKIIEQEKEKIEKLRTLTPFGFYPFAKKPVKSHKKKTTHRKPIKKRTYRD